MPQNPLSVKGPDGKTYQFPPDATDQEITEFFQKQAPTTPTAESAAPTERPGYLSGVWEQVNPFTMAKGLATAIASPIETAKGLVRSQVKQFEKAKDLYNEGRYVEAGGHALAGAVPVVGPMAADIGEDIGAGNVRHGLGSATGLLGTILGPEAVTRSIRAMHGTGPAERIANAADVRAGQVVANVIAPQVGPNKLRFSQMARDVGPEIAAEPGMGAVSVRGLAAKIEDRLEQAANALDEAAAARNPGAAYPTAPILESLQKAKQSLMAEAVKAETLTPETVGAGMIKRKIGVPIGSDVMPTNNALRASQIDQAMAEIQKLGPVARYDALKQIRQSYDKVAKIKYSPSVTTDFLKRTEEASGAADAAGAIREALAEFSPQTAAANRDYAIWKKADTVMKAAEEVQRARPTVGRMIMARMFGTVAGHSVAGGLGEIVGFTLAPLLDNAASAATVGRKIMYARVLSDVGVALKSGNVAAIEQALKRARALSVTSQAAARGQQ